MSTFEDRDALKVSRLRPQWVACGAAVLRAHGLWVSRYSRPLIGSGIVCFNELLGVAGVWGVVGPHRQHKTGLLRRYAKVVPVVIFGRLLILYSIFKVVSSLAVQLRMRPWS
jgi:hypothetical protein